MKYNIIKTTAICLGAMALTACSDWLEPTTDSQRPESLTFSNKDDINLATLGLYSDLCSDPYIQLQTIHQGAGTDCELIDGLGATAYNQNTERDGMNYAASTSWAKLGTLWEKQYKTIEDCNRVITGIANSNVKDESTVRINDAEARVIRAMVYLDIIRVWGDVPFRWEPAKSDLSSITQGKTDRDIILDALIEDLEKVVEENKLPWCGGATTQEHINMGYAKGLLANIYMTRAGYALREDSKDNTGYVESCNETKDAKAKYPKESQSFKTLRPSDDKCAELYWKAAKQLKDIIDNGTHKMNATFAGFWHDYVNKRVLDPMYESMFEIPMGFSIAGELGYTVGVRMNGATIDWGFQNSAGKLKTSAVQLYKYQPTDTRRDITCIPYELRNVDRSGTYTRMKDYTFLNDSVIEVDGKKYAVTENKETYNGEEMNVVTDYGSTVTIHSLVKNKPFALYIGKWDVRYMADDWKQMNKTASLKFGYGINTIRMRYPQILLWYAECVNYLAESGKPSATEDFDPDEYLPSVDVDMDRSKAGEYVEMVHNRAFEGAKNSYVGNTPTQDKQDFSDELGSANSYETMLDMIDLENRLEFCGECFRKWDLIRWNRLHHNICADKIEYQDGWTEDEDGKTRFQQKIYYKYEGEDDPQIIKVTQKDAEGNDYTAKFYYAPEKNIDWSTATWYGKDGNNKEAGTAPDRDWINEKGYRYKTTDTRYNKLGFGTENKDFNGQSYAMDAFGRADYTTRDADLQSIAHGLVGTSVGTSINAWPDAGISVKNRYIMPIENNVKNSSNGYLKNSYGYGN